MGDEIHMKLELTYSILTRDGWITEGDFEDPNSGFDLDYHSHVGLFTVLLGIS